MIPLDINKRIAELKGCKIDLVGTYDSDGYKDPNALSYRDARYSYSKNWAENISDAWELFEEMPYFTTLQKVSDHGDPVWAVECEMLDIGITTSTAPEAICLAWIKWKEGQS